MIKPKVMSLYTGAGGLDYGFEAANYDLMLALEMNTDCCLTIRANRDWPILQKDINDTSGDELLYTASLKRGELDVLIGGPPCQPFSKSAYWTNGDTRRLEDPRADTLLSFMRVVEELQPRVFLLENVHGINYTGKEEGFLLLHRMTQQINRLHRTQYTFSWKVINAASYGVPQIRTRFFLVGERDGSLFHFPDETHSNGPPMLDMASFISHRQPYVTAWESIGCIEPNENEEDLTVKGKWADLLPSIPEGENYLWHTDRKGGVPLFGWRTRYWSFLLKLAKNKPSWTIQAQPGPAIGPFHWKNRRLSVCEMAAIQTFPPDIRFIGTRTSIQRQIGNAVPSLLSEVIARAIGEQFFGLTYTKPLYLQVERSDYIPQPEPTSNVPERYLGGGLACLSA